MKQHYLSFLFDPPCWLVPTATGKSRQQNQRNPTSRYVPTMRKRKWQLQRYSGSELFGSGANRVWGKAERLIIILKKNHNKRNRRFQE